MNKEINNLIMKEYINKYALFSKVNKQVIFNPKKNI